MINALIQKMPKRLPQNERDWAAYHHQFIGELFKYLNENGALKDDMPIASRNETVTNIVQNLNGSGHATDSLQLATRAEALKDIVQKLNGAGDALDTLKIASRNEALLGIVSKLTSAGQITDMTAFRQRQLLGTFVGANPISATDAGSNATINIAAFTWRVAGKTDTNYNAGSITGLAYSTTYYIVGTGDPSHTGATLTYTAETSFEATQTSQDTIYLGFITTPAALGGNTGGGGGYEP